MNTAPLDLVYVIGTYPALTTTFIDREIRTLHREGVPLRIVSIRRPDDVPSDEQRELTALVDYLLPVPVLALLDAHLRYLVRRPTRYLGLLFDLLRRPHPTLHARIWTLLHFGEAVCVARIVERHGPVRRLHAHFMDRAALVAMIVGELLDVPFSVTGHASDIYVDPVLLPDKIRAATSVTTCTNYNAAHLASLVPIADRQKIQCVHHGIDTERFRPETPRRPAAPPLILSVGQLKERKGLIHLVEACQLLRDRGYRFQCEIVGGGPLLPRLRAAVLERGLQDMVTLRGALGPDQVLDLYRRASVFTLPCITGDDGDRDGIPNVILEAMAMELPVVSTRHSGIPEAVQDGHSGLLVEPRDPHALADALARLLDNPALGAALGERGRQVVLDHFDVDRNVQRFREGLAL
jgi:glycosyltransferase involved in cell wall biosynthesis